MPDNLIIPPLPNEGYVIPNDNELPIKQNASSGPQETITGEDGVKELVRFVEELISRNNVYKPDNIFIDRAEENLLQSSKYNEIAKGGTNEGQFNLKTLRDVTRSLKLLDSDIIKLLDKVLGEEAKFELKAPQNVNPGLPANKKFVESIIDNKELLNKLKGKNTNFQHLLEGSNDVTTHIAYQKDIVNNNDRLEQDFSSEHHFTVDAPGTWISDVAEIGGIGAIVALATEAFTGNKIPFFSENAITNFYGGIAREFFRSPEKAVMFLTNNALLHLQNPNIANADANTLGFSNISIQSLFEKLASDKDELPLKLNVDSRTARLGPSILSMLPDTNASALFFGKGKYFNPISLLGGGALTFGEQLIPGTGRNLDGIISGVPFPLSLTTSEFRNKDELEPYSAIAKIENPVHIGTESGDKGKKVLSRMGKNRWQLKNLPDRHILRPNITPGEASQLTTALGLEGEKPYISKTQNVKITREDVKEIEKQLEAEYIPFYFHDLRTNEIIAFHAFIRSLSETYAPTWNAEQYYGRVDNVQIYSGITRRDISLSFTIAALNRIDFDIMWKKVNKFVTLVYPQFGQQIQTTDGDNIPFSAPIRGAPIIRMRLGDLIKTNASYRAYKEIFGERKPTPEFGNLANSILDAKNIKVDFSTYSKGLPGIINDLTFDYATATWETAESHVAPMLIEVTLSFTAIHDIAPGLDALGINRAPLYTPVSENIAGEIPEGENIFNNSKGNGSLDETMKSIFK